jgi:light-regulated signal transduction histidine kinase (bacteriophytochrome)
MHGQAGEMTHTENGTATDIALKANANRQAMPGRQDSDGGLFVPSQLPIESFDVVGQTSDQFRKRVKENFPDLVLADDKLVQWRGMEALEILRRKGLDIPVILDRAAQQEESMQTELAKKVKELARSNGELEQFAYVASHDLEEPLRMVSAYTQLLAEQYRGKLDDKADKYIRYAVDGAARMRALIHDLLEFSRAGRPDNGLKKTDCGEEVKHVVSNLQAAIRETGAVVTCCPLPIVMAHAFQLRQVFQNLIGNAIKFHDGQPPAIQVSAERRGSEWVFSVTDNGISIAPEHVEIIFAIFQRLHTRAEYPGNGIGLAICKKIVEQHGGNIWVEPQAAQGATFKFTWPASMPEKQEQSCRG